MLVVSSFGFYYLLLLWYTFGCFNLVICTRLVEFKTQQDAGRALSSLHETMLDGRKIYLKKVSIPPMIFNQEIYRTRKDMFSHRLKARMIRSTAEKATDLMGHLQVLVVPTKTLTGAGAAT